MRRLGKRYKFFLVQKNNEIDVQHIRLNDSLARNSSRFIQTKMLNNKLNVNYLRKLALLVTSKID